MGLRKPYCFCGRHQWDDKDSKKRYFALASSIICVFAIILAIWLYPSIASVISFFVGGLIVSYAYTKINNIYKKFPCFQLREVRILYWLQGIIIPYIMTVSFIGWSASLFIPDPVSLKRFQLLALIVGITGTAIMAILFSLNQAKLRRKVKIQPLDNEK